ncbi:hypothetical protein DDB_G0281753 [Dictyostelium discoideum AX4]|uniref:Uncharacterized protein n=1 Tax=Dictyostelium discoideum TaxID=44689 RepID=Q54TH1_DICDI|nr:hypothetical protein DDB_G0281753 [Dictyostelium discoideum AX4]EAL66638.1 hypothetical protein DDB_G0281753 [Dictyostelium discoideum AX4]|eukprot:XP_640620.1 hypothetical protein DDB_G0281753 [Dictyostelium discoideum AX4]
MLRFLIAIIVMITLLSNLNTVNGNNFPNFFECYNKCTIKKDPNYSKNCLTVFPEEHCATLLRECAKECSNVH